nr:MAG TPA: hypothetical protein [Caudoviricetes sp.]
MPTSAKFDYNVLKFKRSKFAKFRLEISSDEPKRDLRTARAGGRF